MFKENDGDDRDIHKRYSRWHSSIRYFDRKYNKLYLSDIDRMWVEYCFDNQIVGIFDLKWDFTNDMVTETAANVYDQLQQKMAPVYIIYINKLFDKFKVSRWRYGFIGKFDEFEYADWLLFIKEKM